MQSRSVKLSLESTMTGVQTSRLFSAGRRSVQPERLDVTSGLSAIGGTPERDMAHRKIKGADFTQNKFAERKAAER